MSYSLYIACNHKEEKEEILSLLKKWFIFPEEDYKCYIGDDLPYVNEEFENLHVGFNLNTTGYLMHLCIICLFIISKKKNLVVYWDDTNLLVDNYKDKDLLTIEAYLKRNNHKKTLFSLISFYLENIHLRKEIYYKCNQTIQNFLSWKYLSK